MNDFEVIRKTMLELWYDGTFDYTLYAAHRMAGDHLDDADVLLVIRRGSIKQVEEVDGGVRYSMTGKSTANLQMRVAVEIRLELLVINAFLE